MTSFKTMTKIISLSLLSSASTCVASEIGTFDSGGKLRSIIHDGAELDVQGQFYVFFDGDVSATVQPHEQRSAIDREGYELKWSGQSEFSNGMKAEFSANWQEIKNGLSFEGTVKQPFHWPAYVKSLDYVFDLPYELFRNGMLESAGIKLPGKKTKDPVFFRGETQSLKFVDAEGNWTISIELDKVHEVSVTDRWEAGNQWTGEKARSYRIRIPLHSGRWMSDAVVDMGYTISVSGQAHAEPAALRVDPEQELYDFAGYGGNLCWGIGTPATPYILKNLKMAWSRFEMKMLGWDENPSKENPYLAEDFELIKQINDQGIPWVMSLWRVPERYYAEPNRKPRFQHGRKLSPDKLQELTQNIGDYLVYLKDNYGAEPELFSFNEPDLGVSVGFTAEGHRDIIKMIGAHLESRGLKTRMLLGDTANPRNSHEYVLPTAMDAEAMKYVAAVSFHSWHDGSPAQYKAWADVAEWLQVPLMIGEAGYDPGSYRNRMYDSYDYGMEETRQNFELLRYARPAISLYWQFTRDYSMVREDDEGNVIPTGRLWLMKHFTDLTPQPSKVIASQSNQEDVYIAAFKKQEGTIGIHVFNKGPARKVTIEGLPEGSWQVVVTTETDGFKKIEPLKSALDGIIEVDMPARCLTSLVKTD